MWIFTRDFSSPSTSKEWFCSKAVVCAKIRVQACSWANPPEVATTFQKVKDWSSASPAVQRMGATSGSKLWPNSGRKVLWCPHWSWKQHIEADRGSRRTIGTCLRQSGESAFQCSEGWWQRSEDFAVGRDGGEMVLPLSLLTAPWTDYPYTVYCTPCYLLSAIQLRISFVARPLAASSRGYAADANWAPKSWLIANPWTTFSQKIWTSSSTGNQEASRLTWNRFDESSKKGFIHLILMTQVEFQQRVKPMIQDKVVLLTTFYMIKWCKY